MGLVNKIIDFFKGDYKKLEKDTRNVFYKYAIDVRNEADKFLINSHKTSEYLRNDKLLKAERLKKLGLHESLEVKQAEEMEKKNQELLNVVKCVDYYATYYSNHKVLFFNHVTDICKQLTFGCTQLSEYLDEIPDETLQDIENFKLNTEDLTHYRLNQKPRYNHHPSDPGFELISEKEFDDTVSRYPHLKNVKYFDRFPMMICAPYIKLKIEGREIITAHQRIKEYLNYEANGPMKEYLHSLVYNKKEKPYPVILQPILKFDNYAFIIVSIIKK